MSQRPSSLPQWVRCLSDEEMPVFASTARRIAGISGHTDTPIAELAEVVLQDSAMTAKVLRMANSVYYNPSGNRISTVSRAIVMLGFDVVRAIALSIAMVDTLLRGRQHERVTQEMALSFHAAVQAKAFACVQQRRDTEEVFIATLLYRLGNMAFWCFPHGYERELDDAYGGYGEEAPAENKVLGFTLGDLTAALNREWRLSEMLGRMFEATSKGLEPPSELGLAMQLADVVRDGWDSEPASRVMAEVARLLGKSMDDTRQLLHENAKQASQAAIDFGAVNAARLIPLPQRATPARAQEGAEAAESAGNVVLQLQILRELSTMLAERVDINALLGTVLEGIYRGVGMDRAVFALVSADGKRLTAKYVLGHDRDDVLRCFNLPAADPQSNVLAQVLNGKEPLWLGATGRHWRQYLTPALSDCVGEVDFFAMPISTRAGAKALIYADRGLSRRPLDSASFESFKHFCEQAAIGLMVLGSR